MPGLTAADTIRILVSTDNHVGYNERDPVRGKDSYNSFNEVMELAKTHDVDMVLLAGDLFHENKPSRQSMYQVMQSLRRNCYGEKPCELQMLSDTTDLFGGPFNHVNYEDPDINVAIPVFSIHGNHDDPSGEGPLAALDILQMSGLLNYYGRTPEADNIHIKPVLLQKGNTKLALYGMSNVRDERLFRTFRDGNVKFYQPGTQKDDWYNIMSVHQNAHAYTDTGYLPENFLPSFLDLVIWGHEHECKIDPRYNPETNFSVMQPGSSVATSLCPGEAEPKYVAILSVTGRECTHETLRLKTVRPFVMREIVLADEREMRDIAFEDMGTQRPKITRFLQRKVDEIIEEAKEQHQEARREAGEEGEEAEPTLPLVRLRVEYTAPDGGEFHCDNPQRLSNSFVGKVANVNDVFQFHRKRKATKSIKGKPDMPEEAIMAQMQIDGAKVEKLVHEFLTAQSLTILPQNSFSDAVGQFVDKDDKTAMEEFVVHSLKQQVMSLVGEDEDDEIDEERVAEMMEEVKSKMEAAYAKDGKKGPKRKGSRKPQPDWWNSDADGPWEENLASIVRSDQEADDDDVSVASGPKTKSGRGRGGKAAAGTTKKTAAAKKAPAKATGGRGKKKQVSEDEEEEEEDDDVMVISEDETFVRPAKKAPAKKAPAKSTQSSRGGTQAKATGKQSQLNFGSSQVNGRANGASRVPKGRLQEPSEDEISDDDDAFEPAVPVTRNSRARR